MYANRKILNYQFLGENPGQIQKTRVNLYFEKKPGSKKTGQFKVKKILWSTPQVSGKISAFP